MRHRHWTTAASNPVPDTYAFVIEVRRERGAHLAERPTNIDLLKAQAAKLPEWDQRSVAFAYVGD